jgi:hypothetical protein
MCGATTNVRYGPEADIACALNVQQQSGAPLYRQRKQARCPLPHPQIGNTFRQSASRDVVLKRHLTEDGPEAAALYRKRRDLRLRFGGMKEPLVNDWAARSIDQERRRLHERETPSID